MALKRAVHAAGVVISLGFGCLLGLLGEEDGLDVGEDAALGDGHSSEQLVQLLIVTDEGHWRCSCGILQARSTSKQG